MPSMEVSREGLMELAGHEGIFLNRYNDSVGVWTIGVGHTKSAGASDPAKFEGEMSIGEALQLFRKDIAKYAADVNHRAPKTDVSQTEFDALVSFHFNTGGIGRASLVKSQNAGNRKKAAAPFLNWKKPDEILGRRPAEQKLFATGTYAKGGKANIFPADQQGRVQWNKGKSVDLSGEF